MVVHCSHVERRHTRTQSEKTCLNVATHVIVRTTPRTRANYETGYGSGRVYCEEHAADWVDRRGSALLRLSPQEG